MEGKHIDRERIERAVREILIALNDDPDREGLIDTPKRVAKMYEEVFEGQLHTNDEIATMFDKCFTEPNDNLVVIRDIECFSYCEHHMALMYNLKISVAYIPNGKVIGLSKVARIADMVCKRLQIQERIGSDIAYILQRILDTDDIAVFITGTHSCMTARGIRKPDSFTTTHTLRGRFTDNDALRNEVFTMMYGQR